MTELDSGVPAAHDCDNWAFCCLSWLTLPRYQGPCSLPDTSRTSNSHIRLVNDDGNEVPLGETGELCVRGLYALRGYLRAPEHNAWAFPLMALLLR